MDSVASSSEGAAILSTGGGDADDGDARGVVKPRERAGTALQSVGDDGRPALRRPLGSGVGVVAGGVGSVNPGLRRPVAWRPSREIWLKKDAD
jgi:hypothetical protein